MIKVPCGGFKLDENFLGMNENDELSLTSGSSEGEALKQLVTDEDGNVKWEDRLAYDTTKSEFVGTQYSISLDPTSGTVVSQDTIPMELGQTYAVKVARNDGQGTKEYTGLDVVADDDGTLYIGSSDVENGNYPFRIEKKLNNR